jgi:DHA2 family multidrug resistance protein
VTAGLFVAATATLMYVGFNDQMTFVQLMWPQLILGFSFPLIVIPLMDMSVSSLPPEDTASGAGQFNFIRTLASAISTASVVAVWINAISVNKAALAGELHNPQAVLERMHAGGFSAGRALHLLDLIVQGQAVMLGTNSTFLIMGVIMLVAAAVVWVAPKPPRHGAPKIGH